MHTLIYSCNDNDNMTHIYGYCSSLNNTYKLILYKRHIFYCGSLINGERHGLWWPAFSGHGVILNQMLAVTIGYELINKL